MLCLRVESIAPLFMEVVNFGVQLVDSKNSRNPGERTGEQIAVEFLGIEYLCGLWGLIQ